MPLVELLPVGPDTAQWSLWTTTARVVVSDPRDLPAARRTVESLCAQVDLACSRFRPDAEIHKLYRAAGRPLTISPILAELLAAALTAARDSDGLVDPTVAGAMRALGYDRSVEQLQDVTPDLSALPSCGSSLRVYARRAPGWRCVELDGRRLRVPAGVSLDLGAVAKAWAADRAAALVAEQTGRGVLVAIGGDIATAGEGPAAGGHWPVLVCDGPDEPGDYVTLPAGTAMATSSTISRTWRHGGRMMHHVLDPRTSLPAPTMWRTASVAGWSCVEANTLSTAAIIWGGDAVRQLRSRSATARLVTADGDVVRLGAWPQERAA